jgi:hypothetical protein
MFSLNACVKRKGGGTYGYDEQAKDCCSDIGRDFVGSNGSSYGEHAASRRGP